MLLPSLTVCHSHATIAMFMCFLFVEQRYKPLVKAFQDYIKMAPSMDENLARHKLKTLMEKYNDFKKFVSACVGLFN